MSQPTGSKRQKIAWFTKSLVEAQHSSSAWEAMVQLAQDHDFNLLTLVGGMLKSPIGFEAQANLLYEFVNPASVDALIVTGGLGHYIGRDGLQQFCARFHPLPVVSLEMVVAGVPSIVPDFYSGMYALIRHLVEHHGHRRIAFIRGSTDSKSGEERYRAYLDGLAHFGLPLEPDLVAPGTFFAPSGADAVRLLLDDRKVSFGALVAANDEMAIDALQELQARGLRVPEDVAVCGFDNLETARSIIPQLTTVELPTVSEAKLATEMVLALLHGEKVPARTDLRTEIILRQSCGCRSAAMDQVEALPARGTVRATDWVQMMTDQRSSTLAAMINACGPSPAVAEIDLLGELWAAFAAELQGAETPRFIATLQKLTQLTSNVGSDPSAWQSVISVHRRHIHPILREKEIVERAENLWQRGRVFLAETALNLATQRQFYASQMHSILLSVGESLITTFDLTGLMDAVVRELPRLHIPACYIALYASHEPVPAQSRLVVAYNENGRFPLEPEGRLFPTEQILPPGLLSSDRSYSHVVLPLHFHEERLGFVIFQVGPHDGIIYQTLSLQLSSAVRGALLFGEAKQARETALQAKALAEKADQLKTRLLANVTHELRTPLNVISGYSHMALLEPNPYHVELPAGLRKDLENIHDSADHLTHLINDLLDLSRAEIGELDLYPEPLALRAFLEQTFATVAESAHPMPCLAWRLNLPPRLPLIQADPTRLRQIILNLLSNARKFTEQGEIELGAAVAPPHLHIWVRDTGYGIPIDRQEHIFEPFFTEGYGNRRPEGIGLGLTITRQLVALHGGSLALESQPGQGSVFHVYLPLPNLSDRLLPWLPQQSTPRRPALLLISAAETRLPEAADLAERMGWELHRIATQAQLKHVLGEVEPVALAWELDYGRPGDWAIIQQLRSHPQWCCIPFMLFRKEAGSAAPVNAAADAARAVSMTNILVKPLKAKTLADLVQSLQPTPAGGAILIVDDDPQARDAYQRLITARFAGFPVVTAEDGSTALDWLERETPGLVLLDLSMPHVDGFTVLEQLRTNQRTRMVPVIVLTGRLLSYEDIQRLDHSQVVLQFKDVLSDEQTVASVQRAFAGAETIPQPTSQLVKMALAYIQQHYARTLSRAEIAATVGVSEDYLSRVFNKETGVSPWEYLNRYRVQQARRLLRATKKNVTWIAAQVGFEDPAYFSRVFQRIEGCSPREYRTRAGA
jgi:signal transduction histidine kinase/DNA-binding LacI/PurR family transcriptional regulator/CheY-like chemotaxis protein